MKQYTTYILFSESLDAHYNGFTGDIFKPRLAKHLPNDKGFTVKAKDREIVHTKYIKLNQKLYKERKN